MAEKAKILVMIRHPVGGIRTYLKYTYRYLDKAKYHLTILTVRDAEGNLIKKDLSGFELEIVEVQGRFIFVRLVSKAFITLLRGKFDLIHSQGFTAGLISVLGNIISGTPHILTSHDVFRKDQFTTWSSGLKKYLLGMLLGKADFIQSVSCDAQENLIHFLPGLRRKEGKLVVIRNGVLVNQTALEDNEDVATPFRKELGITDKLFLFGFLGRFMPQKGFDSLIDAVQVLSKEPTYRNRFRIAAVNDGAYIREYKKLVTEKGVSDYFLFCGFTPDVNRVLVGLDALVMPSRWEACPLIPAEALVVGCPVIASDCIGLREVVRDTPALLVKKEDSMELAEGLRIFMRKPAEVKARTLAFMPEARRRFSSERTAAQLDGLFHKALTMRRDR